MIALSRNPNHVFAHAQGQIPYQCIKDGLNYRNTGCGGRIYLEAMPICEELHSKIDADFNGDAFPELESISVVDIKLIAKDTSHFLLLKNRNF